MLALAFVLVNMATALQQALERTEISKIPKAVQNKLEKILTDKQAELESIRIDHERFKTDSGEELC